MKKRGALAGALQRMALPIVVILVLTGIAMARYNFRVTGDAFRLPYQVYETTHTRTPVFLWQSVRPAPAYPDRVFRDFDENLSLAFYDLQQSIPGFLMKNLVYFGWAVWNLFNVFLLPLIAAGPAMVAWARQNKWARFALLTYGVTAAGILLETYMNIHYLALIFGLNFVFIVQSIQFCRSGNGKFGPLVLVLVPLLAVASLAWSLYSDITNNSSVWAKQRARVLNELRRREENHLVIVSYGPRHSAHDWVYNEADIDNAKVVFARQIDPADDCKLADYFHGRRIWALHIDDDWAPPKLTAYPRSLCN